MAYTDTQHTHKRLAGLTGVALIHIALAAGLAAGLTIKYTATAPETRTEVWDVPLPPPPPTPDDVVEPETPNKPEVQPDYVPPVVPPTRIDLARTVNIPVTLDIPPPNLTRTLPPIVGGDAGPPQPPAYTPRDPSPTNGPSGWLSNRDYPTRALQRGWEGDVTYALSIGTDGKVDDCRVIASSGHSILDRTACNLIERKARFTPATDSTGAEVAGTYRGTVSWMIPEN